MLKRLVLCSVLFAPLGCNLNPKGELPSATNEDFPEPELNAEEAPSGAEPEPDRAEPTGPGAGPDDIIAPEPEFVDPPSSDEGVDDDSANEAGTVTGLDAGVPNATFTEAGLADPDGGPLVDAAPTEGDAEVTLDGGGETDAGSGATL